MEIGHARNPVPQGAHLMQWFRYYHEALDDPKLQRCSDAAFRCWVNLMSLNCRCDGALPDIEDVAFCLRLDVNRLRELLKELRDMVSVDGGQITITNWSKRQYRSDNSTERSRKHRATKVQRRRNVAVTPPETDTETDNKPPTPLSGGTALPEKPKRKNKTPLPKDFPDAEAIAWACREHGLTESIAKIEAEGFRDYWLSEGKPKADWMATWRNRIRSGVTGGRIKLNGAGPPGQYDELARQVREEKQREREAANG